MKDKTSTYLLKFFYCPKQLRKHLGRSLLKIGAGLGGFWIASIGFNILFHHKNHISLETRKDTYELNNNALPKKPIMIIVIGTSENNRTRANKQSNPKRIEMIFLIRSKPDEPLRIVQIPINIAVKLPGNSNITTISQLYNKGGVALVSDVTAELLGIENQLIQRYILLSSNSIETLINSIGGIEIDLQKPLRSAYNVNGYSLSLKEGNHSLNSQQVLQLISYRDNIYDEEGRRNRRKVVLKGINKKLRNPYIQKKYPDLIQIFNASIKTNISYQEFISLSSTYLSNKTTPIFSTVPLLPRRKEQLLRQIEPGFQIKFILEKEN